MDVSRHLRMGIFPSHVFDDADADQENDEGSLGGQEDGILNSIVKR